MKTLKGKRPNFARPAAAGPPPDWLGKAAALVQAFSTQHKLVLGVSERALSASFEIGCLHALLRLYEKHKFQIVPSNLVKGSFRYLTTPSGNPLNFSFVEVREPGGGVYEVRQQVRVQSHVAPDIRFTPDIVVLERGASITGVRAGNYANGNRAFFQVSSDQVVAAHECKSTNPFPELMVSFVGMLVTAHKWHPTGTGISPSRQGHLAPTLFVGGSASAFHLKMIEAMQTAYMLNIVVGMHSGTWSLRHAKNRFHWQRSAPALAPPVPGAIATNAKGTSGGRSNRMV